MDPGDVAAGGDEDHRLGAVFFVDLFQPLCRKRQRLIPGDSLELSPLPRLPNPLKRVLDAVRRVDPLPVCPAPQASPFLWLLPAPSAAILVILSSFTWTR